MPIRCYFLLWPLAYTTHPSPSVYEMLLLAHHRPVSLWGSRSHFASSWELVLSWSYAAVAQSSVMYRRTSVRIYGRASGVVDRQSFDFISPKWFLRWEFFLASFFTKKTVTIKWVLYQSIIIYLLKESKDHLKISRDRDFYIQKLSSCILPLLLLSSLLKKLLISVLLQLSCDSP